MIMRKKVSTLLDETLFRRLKLEAVRQGKQISSMVGEALEQYLSERPVPHSGRGIVAESWGVLPLSPREVKRILDQTEDVLDAG